MSTATMVLRAGRVSQVSPSEDDTRLAKESCRHLAAYAGKDVRLCVSGGGNEVINLPGTAVSLLVTVLNEFAEGNAVSLMALRAELTTQQAAALLGVSRPFLVKELDEKRIPYRKVGAHRRLLLADVLRYKEAMDAKRHEVLDELVAQSQDLGAYA